MSHEKPHAIALLLFACTAIGANDCALTEIGKSAPPPPPTTKPFCQFDPPVGCRAICTGVGAIGFTGACDDISAGPLTEQFRNAIQTRILQAMLAGQTFCTQDDIDTSTNISVTPCLVGITPQPNPPESQDVCMNPLPGCVQ